MSLLTYDTLDISNSYITEEYKKRKKKLLLFFFVQNLSVQHHYSQKTAAEDQLFLVVVFVIVQFKPICNTQKVIKPNFNFSGIVILRSVKEYNATDIYFTHVSMYLFGALKSTFNCNRIMSKWRNILWKFSDKCWSEHLNKVSVKKKEPYGWKFLDKKNRSSVRIVD